MESSRTSLASRTYFEVLGLEASSPQTSPCPRLEHSIAFEPLKFCWKTPETWRKICKDLFLVSSSRDRLKKIFEDLFRLKKFFVDFFFLRSPVKIFEDLFFFINTCVCVLGPWPREGLSLVGLGLEIFLCPWP